MEVRPSVFYKDGTAGKSAMLQWMAPQPGIYGQHRLELMGYYFQKKKEGTKLGWEGDEN